MDRLLALEHQANDEFHDARKAYEDAKQKYEQDLRNLKTSRNEAEHRRNEDKAHAKNFWALANEKIQSERHNLFERYRNSGGYSREPRKDSFIQVGPESRKEG